MTEIGMIGTVLAIGFLLTALAAAYIAFRMLRKTVKIALRMTIVAAILVIGLAGAIGFFYLNYSGTTPPRNRPAANRQR